MPLITNWPLTTDFLGVNSLQANGSDVPGPSPSGDQQPAGIPGRLDIVPDPTGARGGVMRAWLRESDAEVASGKRCEIAKSADEYDEYWYAWDLMLDPAWGSMGYNMILGQLHDTPSGETNAPSALLTIEGGNFGLRWPVGTPTPTTVTTRVGVVPAVPGRWYRFGFHVLWSKSGSAGFREWWCNGARYASEYSKPTNYDDPIGPFLKLGVYDSLNAPAGWVQKIAYYSDVRVWRGPATAYEGLGMHMTIPPCVQLLP